MISSKILPENDYFEAFDSFCKLVIVSFVMGLNKNFKVRVAKCRFHERHQKLGECEDREAFDSTLHIGHLFGPNGVQGDYCRKGSKLTL